MTLYKAKPGTPLSPRQREILTLTAEGLNATEVAAKLWIVRKTVYGHMRQICIKLGAANATHAVYLGCVRGLLPLNGGKREH